MVLAEEDPLEVARIGAGPQIDVPAEVVVDCLGIGSQLGVEWLMEELEQPRLDHATSPHRSTADSLDDIEEVSASK